MSMMRGTLSARTVGLGLALVLAGGCTTNPYTGEQQASRTGIGVGVGAATGAAIGAIAGGGKGAAIGAGVGALAGGGVGAYMDHQETLLRQRLQGTGVSVTRVGNSIVLNMPGNVTFQTDSADLRPEFFEVLNSVAIVLQKYHQTAIEVTGHTDSSGSDSYNFTLSERRATTVGHYLQAQGVLAQRFSVRGMGENQPIADNNTPEGRSQNRRVEIRLIPVSA
jgi:outer membrane protein OmpA-like peptidoglycan-associated protein